MKRFKNFSIVISLFALFFSCAIMAQGKTTKELGAFQELKVFDGISVELIPANENKAEISGEDADDLVFVQKKGKLKIRMRLSKVFNGYDTFVKLYYKYPLEVIDVNENAKVFSEEVIKSNIDLEIRAQEAGIAEVQVDTQKLLIKSVSGGLVTVAGISKTQDVQVNTGGFYKGEDLISEQAKVVCATGAYAYAHASEWMSVKVKAGGTVHVYGNPKALKKKTILGGRIVEN